MGGAPSSEDCLFLDFFVPGKALRGEIHNVPVINYIFGGAYIVGVKDGMYDGSYLVKQADGEVIVVVGNYRLGAFGFLGGETMIKENSAVPNAAFWDQRAVLEWIQKYVGLVNGDAGNVSLWGESVSSELSHAMYKGLIWRLGRSREYSAPFDRLWWYRTSALQENRHPEPGECRPMGS
jgi:carboxylesterase type B